MRFKIVGTGPTINAETRLILAIDFASQKAASEFIMRIGAPPIVYKIGLELIYAGGLPLVAELVSAGREIFLDAKLLDIGHTVERACASVATMGATFLTVHASDTKTLAAAERGREGSNLKLLGVTVLTNLGADDLTQQGHLATAEELALQRAQMAFDAGFDGVITSPWEAAALKQRFGRDFLIVTPGIRPTEADTGDQSRVMTPSEALHSGADYLVIGRPITQSPDPVRAMQSVLDEMQAAFALKPI